MFVTEARCYLIERILRLRIGLVWLLVLAGVLMTTTDPLSRLPALAIITALFILVFRLWDDLADLGHDRRHHPDRCLSRVNDLQPFHMTQWLLVVGLAALLFLFVDEERSLAFLGLAVAFYAMYRVTGKRPALRHLRAALVLAKYPAFVLLLAHAPGDPVAPLVALSVYLLPLVDEVRSTGPGIMLPAAAFLGIASLTWLSLTI